VIGYLLPPAGTADRLQLVASVLAGRCTGVPVWVRDGRNADNASTSGNHLVDAPGRHGSAHVLAQPRLGPPGKLLLAPLADVPVDGQTGLRAARSALAHRPRISSTRSCARALIWSAATGAAIQSSPTVADGVVYVGSEDAKLYAFNAKTWAILWNTATAGHTIQSSLTVVNGVVYVGAFDSKLYAFDLPAGSQPAVAQPDRHAPHRSVLAPGSARP
jgi:hypothetical protein